MVKPEGEPIRDKLVHVEFGGFGPCVDGRLAKRNGLSRQKLRAPKIQGGVLGVAALGSGKSAAEIIDEHDIRLACRKVKSARFTPSIHGDGHHGVKGCGFGRLWADGELTDLPKLGVSLERIREIVIEEGGKYIELEGNHSEEFIAVNHVRNMTLEPDGKMFILDVWAAALFGIDQEKLLANAVTVVKKLNGPADKIQEIR